MIYENETTNTARVTLNFNDDVPERIQSPRGADTIEKYAADFESQLEEALAYIREYRKRVAARKAELETMHYNFVFEISREKDRDGVKYIIRKFRLYEDGTETGSGVEFFTGRERVKALKRVDELVKENPGSFASYFIA